MDRIAYRGEGKGEGVVKTIKQIKVFSGEDLQSLESQVNAWGSSSGWKSWRVVGVHKASFLTHITVEYEQEPEVKG